MRPSRASAVLVVAALALGGCAAGPATPDATVSRDVATAYRCLADHSPWSVDLDGVFDAWLDTVPEDRAVRGGEVTGTATLSFTRGSVPRWTFTATGVDFELFLGDGTTETTSLARELEGRYDIPEPGGALTLTRIRVIAAATDATTVAADGTRTEGVSVVAPRFPWETEDGEELPFTCTEHRLVVGTSGPAPFDWSLYPG
jgi:hypothetical protein